jgi:hypothetical protein
MELRVGAGQDGNKEEGEGLKRYREEAGWWLKRTQGWIEEGYLLARKEWIPGQW